MFDVGVQNILSLHVNTMGSHITHSHSYSHTLPRSGPGAPASCMAIWQVAGNVSWSLAFCPVECRPVARRDLLASSPTADPNLETRSVPRPLRCRSPCHAIWRSLPRHLALP